MKKDAIVLIALYDPCSFAIRTLHAVLKKKGFNVHSVFFKQSNPNNTMDRPTNDEIEAFINLIVELEPALIGMSVVSALFELASTITEKTKQRLDTLVMWGGVHPTVRPAQCMEYADILCIGEGEETIVEVATKLFNGEALDNIKNLWLKKENKIVKNDVRSLIQDLDSLPFPDVSGENKYFIENGHVRRHFFQKESVAYPIMSTRGCPFNCTFCSSQLVKKIYHGKGKYVRRRSVEHVIAELVQAKKLFKNLKKIHFWDDVFTFDLNWIKEFCHRYKSAVGIPFFCYFHPKLISEELIRHLKDAGVEIMTAGIQSGSERTSHQFYKRYVKNSEIVEAARLIKKYNIDCAYDLILDNPLETEKDRSKTLNLLLKLPRPFEVYHATLTHFPETELTRLLLEKGLISESDVEDLKQKGFDRWSLTLDLHRDRENLFWENLYFLANKKHVPKWFVVLLSHCRLLKRNPTPLTMFLRRLAHHLRTGTRSDLLLENSKIMLGDSLMKQESDQEQKD